MFEFRPFFVCAIFLKEKKKCFKEKSMVTEDLY